jgi:hypothetical protein
LLFELDRQCGQARVSVDLEPVSFPVPTSRRRSEEEPPARNVVAVDGDFTRDCSCPGGNASNLICSFGTPLRLAET